MRRPNKYEYLYVVQGNYGYGHGWEDLTAADTDQDGRAYLKDYRDNEPNTPHRLIKRRILNNQ